MPANYFDQFDGHAAGPMGMPNGGIRIGAPDPAKAYDPQLKRADLAAKEQEAQIRALQLKKLQDDAAANATIKVSSDVHGTDYLKTLPPDVVGMVRKIATGDVEPPKGTALRTPYWQQMMQHVINYDPAFNASDYGTRAATRRDYATGKMGLNVTALNTALGHAGEVKNDVAALGNYGGALGTSIANPIMNYVRSRSGDPRTTNFQNDVRAFGGEMAKVFAGSSGGGERERGDWATSVPLNGSPQQQMGVLQHDAALLRSRLGALDEQYKRGMGNASDITDLLNPEARRVYEALLAGDPENPNVPPPAGNQGGGRGPSGGPGSGSPSDALSVASGASRNERIRTPEMTAVAGMAKAGASASDIRAFLSQHGIDPATVTGIDQAVDFHRKYPNAAFDAYEDRVVPNSPLTRASATPLATAGVQSADALFGGMLDEGVGAVDSLVTGRPYAEARDAADQAKRAQADLNPGAALAGNFAGGSLAMLGGGALAARTGLPNIAGRFAAPLADAAYGAAYGAGENNDNRLLGAGIGAAGGIGGSYVGSRLTRGIGRGLRGVQNGAVRYLDAAGVPMTGGQMLGGMPKAIEDKLTSIPFVGDAIKARRGEGYVAFNQAGFRQGGQPIGATVEGVGDAGLANLDAATGRAYDAALNGVTVNGNDPAFLSEMQPVLARGQGLPEPMAGNADYTLRTRIGNSFQPNGDLSGRNFQQAVRGLRRDSASLSGQPYGYDFGQVTRGAENALEGLLGRQAPGAVPAYRAANAAYRNQMVLDAAVRAAKNQIDDSGQVLYTPAQLNTASVKAGMFGRRSSSATRPFMELAQAGQQVLPSKTPDSGTAGRGALAFLPSALGGSVIGAGAGYGVGQADTGSELGTGIGLTAAALNTRAGQRALTAALLRRPQVLERAGNTLINRAAVGGIFGRSVGAPLLLLSQQP